MHHYSPLFLSQSLGQAHCQIRLLSPLYLSHYLKQVRCQSHLLFPALTEPLRGEVGLLDPVALVHQLFVNFRMIKSVQLAKHHRCCCRPLHCHFTLQVAA